MSVAVLLPALLQRMGQVPGAAQTCSTSSQMPRAHAVLGCALRVQAVAFTYPGEAMKTQLPVTSQART